MFDIFRIKFSGSPSPSVPKNIDYAKILIHNARKAIVLHQFDDSEMYLLRASWISETKNNIILQVKSFLLITLVYLKKIQSNSDENHYKLALKYIAKTKIILDATKA